MKSKQYKSKYILRALQKDYHPLTPNLLHMNEEFVVYRRRNWHLVSEDEIKIHFQNVVGIDIDKHLFGASLRFITNGRDVHVHGFTKVDANEVLKYCSQFIQVNSRRATNDALRETIVATSTSSTEAVVGAINSPKGVQTSVADELKKMKELLDTGIITQEEFNKHKTNLLN